MRIFHRHSQDDCRTTDPSRDVADGITTQPDPGISVLLSPGLAEMAPALAHVLGSEFDVTTEAVRAHGVMITGPVGPVGVAFLRASYPGIGLLVVDRRWPGRRPTEAVVHLEAGADGYLSNPTIVEVASHVLVLTRRSANQASSVSAA